jgi:RNA polymerase sigma-70 factor, ECF subfamily
VRTAPAKPRAIAEDDASLVARACAGDDGAFAELFRRHSSYVARLAYRLLGDESEVDDVVQDTFVRALGAVGQIRQPERVRSWLATVAVRHVHHRLKQRSRWSWLRREVAYQMPRPSDPALEDRVVALYGALADLPPKLRVPWVLHCIEGHTHADVAEMCGASIATVKRRIGEAEQRLERRLHEPR